MSAASRGDRPGPGRRTRLVGRHPQAASRLRTGVALLALVGGVAVVRAEVAAPVTVTSDSMAATLAQGDTVLLDKLTPRLAGVERGHLVAFRSPDDGAAALKRVIGVAGDEVAIRDAVLHVNGAAVAEPYVDLATVDGSYFGPVTVPAGSVFVMGDNRANSVDSRDYGPVSTARISGRVLFQIWP